ncbi:MAG: hypothetical protein IBX72_14845 [Nitrospirae bacterium]|nr:hypothetical protein [Nitrospirota bacterium]
MAEPEQKTKTMPPEPETKKTKKKKQKSHKESFKVWTDEENALLKQAWPALEPHEIQKLYPYRTWNSIKRKAFRQGIKKTPVYISAKQSRNPSKTGMAHFADYPVEALAAKHPDLKQAYDDILAALLAHPKVDPENTFMVEMLKEAVLHKVTQFILMRDRIEKDLKGKQLIINPRTGTETWIESRYPHSPDIAADSKLARQILKDLGIISEQEHKVDIGYLRLLWEDDEEGDEGNSK